MSGPDMEMASGIAAFEAKEFARAMQLLQPLAERGAAEAQYRVAIMAQVGLGMVKNCAIAVKWMRAAADQGFALAEHGLGFMYFQGECTKADAAEAVRWFESQGAKTLPVELPNAALAVPVYYVLAPAEASSNLSRFDGVRYGHRAEVYSDLADMYCRTRAEGFGAEVKRRILVGTYVLSHGYYDAYYLQAQKLRRLIAQDFAVAFRTCDVILGPTTPTTAFPIGAKIDDPVQMYLNDIFTIPAPLAGLPGLSVPCGFDDKGLPVGLQLTGNYFSEARLLGIAHRYQQATDWHLRVPTEAPL